MPDIVIRDADFRVAHRSRNLRGILDYSRNHVVTRIDCYGPHANGTGTLGIAWADGATCITDFADYAVMVQWVKARRRMSGHLIASSRGDKHIAYTEGGQ